MQYSDFEIMAPVGSPEALAAALQAGADSVYFGIEGLNMRAHSAAKFTIDDLHRIAQMCDEKGVKSYLTVNTIIYDEDLALMRRICDAAKAAGISAVIAADVAVLGYCHSIGQEVHLSTQLNITNVEALKFYAQFADVVVLARELHMDQVANIYEAIVKEQIKGPAGELVRIEMFCHGALCMAVSGKCYLSLDNQGSSANRGACLQQCRRSYIVTDKQTGTELEIDNEYIMSPKDLKTIGFLDRMMRSGVRVFKIEGRARSAEYVYLAVKCYKEAVKAVVDGTFTKEKVAEWDKQLATVFNRGFWDGYYQGQKLGEWTKEYGSSATEKKVYVGKGTKYFGKLGVGEFLIEAGELNKGDKLLVVGPTTGVIIFTAEEIRYDMQVVDKATKGQRISMKVDQKIRESDKLYKLIPSKYAQQYSDAEDYVVEEASAPH